MSHQFSWEQMADRIIVSQNMWDMMSRLRPKQRKYFITGDESWIFRNNEQQPSRDAGWW
jgi:hypothetical protein